MKRFKREWKRMAAIALAVLMVSNTIDMSVFAATESEFSCEHHTEHTAECGYVEAVEGSPCTHVHDETCGYDTVSGNEACNHVHDEICGYAEAVEGTPCSYVCESCADEENEEQPENETAECTCGTDDDSIHATNCAVYVAPESPVCTCVEKCTEVNIWCDVCGFDYTQCGGTDTAVPYADCTCETKCTSDNVNSDCTVCSAEGADLTACTDTDTAADTTYPYAVVDTAAGTVTIDGTLGGKTTATEDDITALVDAIKGYVESGNTTITVTGSEPALYNFYDVYTPAVSVAIFRLTEDSESSNGSGDQDSPYCGKIDLILQDVTEIVEMEFHNSFALNSITLPKVTKLAAKAFTEILYLRTITFGSVLTEVNETSDISVEAMFHNVGKEVGGCDLFINCGQMNESSVPAPDLTTKTWTFTYANEFKSITLTHTISYQDLGNGTHSAVCTVCGDTGTEDHSGGEATCTTLAICSGCGVSYGEVDSDNHTAEPTYTVNELDSTQHDAYYSCCGATVTEAHSFDSTTGKCGCGLYKLVLGTIQAADWVESIGGELATDVPAAAETSAAGYSLRSASVSASNLPEGTTITVTNTTRQSAGLDYHTATYTLTDGVWTSEDFILISTGDVIEAACGDTTLPDDQSGGVSGADRMTASGTVTAGTALDLTFSHQLTKVTVKVTMWNSEFPEESNPYLSEVSIYTKVDTPITAYEEGDGIYPTFTAILPVGSYNANQTFMTLLVNGGQELTVPVNGFLTAGLEAGYHYTFNLTVGQELLKISKVTVTEWDEETKTTCATVDTADNGEFNAATHTPADNGGSNIDGVFEGTADNPATIGITVTNGDYSASNVRGTHDGTGWTSDSAIYGLDNSNITAYYPYSESGSIEYDLATGGELLYGTATASGSSASLNLDYKLAKLVVKVSGLPEGTDVDKMELSGIYTTATFDGSTGKVTPTGDKGAIGLLYGETLLIPMTEEEVTLRIKLSDNSVYTTTMKLAPTAGTEHWLTVNLEHTGTLSYEDNGDGTHTATWSCCGETFTEDHSGGSYSVSDAVITDSCTKCGTELGTATISATGKNYNGTVLEATVTKTGSLENEAIAITYAVKDGATLESAPMNAGTYTASITLGEGENAVTASVEFTIAKATPTVSAVPTVPDRTYSPSVTLQDIELTGGTVVGVNGNTLEGTWSWQTADIPTVDKKVYVAVFTPADTNYDTVTATIEVNVAKATPDIGTVSANPSVLQNTLDVTKVVLSRTDEIIAGTLEITDDTLQYGTHTYNWKFTPTGDYAVNYKEITGTVEITVNDTIAPTATYKIGTDGWKQFINTISFGLFCKDYKTVEIEYSDGENGSGIATKQYYISNEEITDTSSIEWKDYTGKINLNATGTYFIYVRVVDNGGNEVILNSEGIVIYAESTISPTNIDYTYKSNADVSVQIALNGNTFAKLTDGEGNEIATDNYTIDEAGKLTLNAAYLDTLDVGAYTYKIYMNPQGVETTEVTLAYTFTVNVTAKELTVTGATATSRDYNETNTVEITGVTLSGIESSDAVTVDLTGLQGTLSSANAGTYTEVTLPTLTLTGADAGNYTLVQPKEAVATSVEISKATYSVEEINKSYLYSKENADSINIAKLLPTDCGTVSYGTPTTTGTVTYSVNPSVTDGTLSYTFNSGAVDATGTITVVVETQNYEDITITVNVELIDQIPVSPKEGTEVTLKNNTLTYGEALSKLEFNSVVFVGTDGKEVAGTLAWKDADATPNAGTTSATWVFTPDNEEYASLEGSVAITVKKATPTVSAVPTVADRIYNPSVALQDSDLKNGTVSVPGTWNWQTANTIPVVNNSGYVAVFTPEDTTNYETVTRTITVKVTQATPVIAQISGTTITYGDSLAASSLSGTAKYSASVDVTVAGTFAWKDATENPVVADSDTTAYEVVFTPKDSVNYTSVDTTVKITVNKAEKAPNMPEGTRGVIFETKKVSSVTLPTGWAWQSGETALEVGVVCNAVAVYTGEDAGNYETESVTVAITRAECTHDGESELRDDAEESCTEDGYTGDTYCLVCDEKIGTGEAIPATGHKDNDKDHVCDNGCDVVQGICEDTDKDHACDYGCDKVFGIHEAASGKHTCEYCGKAATNCKDDNHDHVCDICGEELEHSFLTEWKYDEDGHWHVCSCGLKKDEAEHSFTNQVTKQPTVHAEGERTYTCSECEYSYTEPVDKLKEVPAQPTQPTIDPGKPFIQDDTGKIGWEVIRGETAKAKEGDTIIVDMNGTTTVPGAVFDDIKGKDITITLDMGTGVSWTINGKDITAGKVSDINFEVKVGTKEKPVNTIPVEVINKVTGERYFVNISLTHDGELGLKAILNINLDKKNAGLFANLFYYNEQYGVMQFIWADDIDEYGTAHLVFTHASEYSIVIDKGIMQGSITSPKTGDTSEDDVVWNYWWIIIISAGLCLSVIAKKKADAKEE